METQQFKLHRRDMDEKGHPVQSENGSSRVPITRTTDSEFRGYCLIIRGTRRLYKLESGAEQNEKRREELEPQPTTTEGEEKNPVSTPCVCILTLRLNVHCKLEDSTMAALYSLVFL